jgi:flagellin
VAFQINTNIPSLQAQEYLRINSDFQSKTINRVTSGLRIVSSGDDAAGLAIANAFRSDQAVLAQGIRNANDGLSTLQIIDGGINNISKLIDRARTLATQSASGTFTGSRSVLNNEFQSLLEEIDRQAQSIGLNTGGNFAKLLKVFMGGGRASGGVSEIANGSVSVDLSKSTVDTKSLGLKGFEAAGAEAIDLSEGQATSVQEILTNAANVSSAGDGFTDFYFTGPGFYSGGGLRVSVNTAGIGTLDQLVAAINGAIDGAGQAGTEAATAFANAGIKASVKVDADGSKRLSFASSNAPFQVRAGDLMANALLGNVVSASNPTGKAIATTVTGGAASTAGALTNTAVGDKIVVRFQGGGLDAPVDITINTNTNNTAALAVADLSSQVANNSALQAAGITMTGATVGSALEFTSALGHRFEVLAAGDVGNHLGLGSYRLQGVGAAFSQGNFDYTTIDGSGGSFADGNNATFEFSIAGGAKVALSEITVATGGGIGDVIDQLNNQFLNNATLRNAQLVASNNGGQLRISSQNGTYFRLNMVNVNTPENFGFGTTGAAAAANAQSAIASSNTVFSGGAATVEATDNAALDWSAIRNATDKQNVVITVTDANGAEKTKTVTLRQDGVSGSARSGATLDEAIREINRQLQQSNDPDFQKVIAVKERIDNNNDGIRFLSSKQNFRVTFSNTASGAGLSDSGTQGTSLKSETSAGGAQMSIETEAGAQLAVSALSQAVSLLGDAQAVVGKGQNTFSYAVNLAQSQLTNIAAAESRIRDADLAAEAANLTKAQIVLQAGIAALGQANSAPQAVLALLRA